MKRSQDYSTQQRRPEGHSKLQACETTSPHVRTVKHGYYNNEWKRFLTKTNQENRLVSEKVTRKFTIFKHQINWQKNVLNSNRPLSIDTLTMKKAMGSIEHEAIFQGLRTIGTDETYIRILEELLQEHIWIIKSQRKCQYWEAWGWGTQFPPSPPLPPPHKKNIHSNNSGLWKCPPRRESNKYRRRKIVGRKICRCDVALTTEDVKDMEHRFYNLNEENLKTGFKIHERNPKFMTNIDTTGNLQTDGTEIEKVANYRYLGQTIEMKKSTRQEVSIRIKAQWSVFWKYLEIFQNRHLPMSVERKVFNQCVLPAMTYRCQTWSFTKGLVKKLETSQRVMERNMLVSN